MLRSVTSGVQIAQNVFRTTSAQVRTVHVCISVGFQCQQSAYHPVPPLVLLADFNTFVCTACSGIHREFNHRVKSISLANFTDEEVRAVRKGGNEACNDLYLAKYDPQVRECWSCLNVLS